MRRSFNNDHTPYVTFLSKNKMAKVEIEALKKQGIILNPVIITDSKIAHSWWAVSWNKNLESYADYKSRIARGRNYLKNDAVLDLKIEKGLVQALVQGSSRKPYKIEVKIDPLSPAKWEKLLAVCANQIGSLSDLVEGRFPKTLENLFMIKGEGLFPSNREIRFSCSCPDAAYMCKHVAAVLYGIGARFDEDPLLFFKLRDLDFEALLSKSIEQKMQNLLKNADKKSDRVIEDEAIFDLFGI
jgi:uncharacterized Zn finger protein